MQVRDARLEIKKYVSSDSPLNCTSSEAARQRAWYFCRYPYLRLSLLTTKKNNPENLHQKFNKHPTTSTGTN